MSEQVRTVVYKIRVDTTDAKKGGRDMMVTMRTMATDSKTAAEAMRNLGDKIEKDYGAKVKIAEDKTKSAKTALRDAAREADRSTKNYALLSQEYSHLASRIGKTADEQEVLNAVYRLGSSATEKQKQEVAQLVTAYQRQRAEAMKVQGSFRGMRGQMQNFGYQMQDVAVQMQMGTNAMTIFSQQGSQLAAGFGPTGAIVGAGIAFAGMMGSLLIPNVMNAGKEIKELTEKLKDLADTTGLTKEQAAVLVYEEQKLIKENQKKVKSLNEEIAAQLKINESYAEYEKRMKKELVLQSSQVNGRVILVKSEKEWIKAQQQAAYEQNKRVADVQKLNDEIANSIKNQRLYNAAVGGDGLNKLKKWNDENKNLVDSMSDQVESVSNSKVELLELNKTRDLSTLTLQGATDAQKESVAASYDALISHERNLELTRELTEAEKERKKALDDLAAAQRLDEEITKKRNTLLASLDIGDTSALTARYKEEQKLLAGNNEALAKLREEYERDVQKATATGWKKYMLELEDQLSNTDEILQDSINRFSQGFGDAFADAIFESENLGDAMANLFTDIGKNMVAFFAEWAAQELALWALKKLIGTEAGIAGGLAMTAEAQAASFMAAIHAFSSTAAIPVVGPALAPGAAGAALAFTEPMVAAISGLSFAGAYDKGGVIPQGSVGIVAEYGQELVDGLLVQGKQGGTRVTGREDTARMMGGNSVSNITINSSGNASPEAIARALTRAMRKPNKQLDTSVYESMNRGRNNRGKRFA